MTPADAAEFTIFMRTHQDKVYSMVVRLIGDVACTQEIVQETFLRAYKNFGTLRADSAAGGWVSTTGRNLALNHLSRYRKRWRFFSELPEKDDADDEMEVEFASPDCLVDGIDAVQRQEIVEQALEGLPEHQRVPLVLFVFEGMPYGDIAQCLGISLKKVRNDIHRARQSLIRKLAHLHHDSATRTAISN